MLINQKVSKIGYIYFYMLYLSLSKKETNKGKMSREIF